MEVGRTDREVHGAFLVSGEPGSPSILRRVCDVRHVHPEPPIGSNAGDSAVPVEIVGRGGLQSQRPLCTQHRTAETRLGQWCKQRTHMNQDVWPFEKVEIDVAGLEYAV